jgi:CRISPR system Cascade subunit CasE
VVTAWLTQVVPDLRHPAVRHDLRDITAVHRRVMSLFPHDLGPQPRQQAGVLFRIDHGPTGPTLLVQSTVPPEPARLPTRYGTTAIRDLTPLVDALHSGMTVHYRIAANAAKRAWKGDHAGKIVALSGREAEQWWHRKADAHGLRLQLIHAEPQPAARGRATPLRHAISRFDGRATIDDPDKVRAALLSGIGRGRSFGCGLLSLAPAR